MTDEQKTCGGCAWFNTDKEKCTNGTMSSFSNLLKWPYTDAGEPADDCETFRSQADAALIAECHRKRSLGTAIPWSDVDRLVELLAGKPLERRKRCEECGGNGSHLLLYNNWSQSWTHVECSTCDGTGYQGEVEQ